MLRSSIVGLDEISLKTNILLPNVILPVFPVIYIFFSHNKIDPLSLKPVVFK